MRVLAEGMAGRVSGELLENGSKGCPRGDRREVARELPVGGPLRRSRRP
jgi:hypothetical protein